MEEIIKDGETGLLVRPDNVEDLATALRTLMADADLRQRLGAAARSRTLAEFTWDGVVQRMAPVLDATFAQCLSKLPSHAENDLEVQ
jgi:glycosyltransferase involved in cell wall biosynthesis